jgi:hypothetical protein
MAEKRLCENSVSHPKHTSVSKPSMFSVFIDTVQKEGTDKIQSLKYLFLAGGPSKRNGRQIRFP